MRLPGLKTINRRKSVISAFGGLNRREVPGDGEFAAICGFTSDASPALTVRPARYASDAALGDGTFVTYCRGPALLVPQEEGCDRLYYRGSEVAAWRTKGLSRFSDVGDPAKISAASIGDWLLFAPYRAWFNTATGECGSMAAGLTVGPGHRGEAYIVMLYDDLTEPSDITAGAEGDTPPAPGGLLDGEAFVAGSKIYRFYRGAGEWREVDTMVYRFFFIGTEPVPMTAVPGSRATAIGLSYVRYDSEGGTSVVTAQVLSGEVDILNAAAVGGYEYVDVAGQKADPEMLLTIKYRYVEEGRADIPVSSFGLLGDCPAMSFVCSASNRVWCCDTAGREIYASALGDPRRWSPYGVGAGDPWAASVGDGDEWTGAVSYRGKPCFFKRDRLFRINGTKPSNFGYSVFSTRGAVSPASFAVVSDRLFYAGDDGVYVWSGGLAERVSDKVGGEWKNAVGGGYAGKYYVCRDMPAGEAELLVYDVARKIWHTETDGRWISRAEAPGGLLYVRRGEDGTRLCSFAPETGASVSGQGAWRLETGELLRGGGKRYLSRLELDMSLGVGARCDLWVSYDGRGDWTPVRSFDCAALGSGPVSFTPRRCGSFKLKLAGKGKFTLYGITLITEEAKEYG